MLQTILRTTDDVIVANTTVGTMTIGSILFANTTSTRRTVRVHHVETGQASATNNALLYDATIAPNSTLVVEMRIALKRGESLRGRADAAGVAVTMYGQVGS